MSVRICLAVLLGVLLTSCAPNMEKVNLESPTPGDPIITVSASPKLATVIRSVQPAAGTSTNETAIRIVFAKAMNEATLHPGNIHIVEEKHGMDLTGLYQFSYDTPGRTLTLTPKHAAFDFGTENTVTITISGAIQDIDGILLGIAYAWSFRTLH